MSPSSSETENANRVDFAAVGFRFVFATPLRSGSWVLDVCRGCVGLEIGFDFMVKKDPGSTPRALFLKRSTSSLSDDELEDRDGFAGRVTRERRISECSVSELSDDI